MRTEFKRSETRSEKHPRDAQFSELLDVWDRWDDHGRNADARAALCLEDRYYLLINVLGRKDMWHPWLHARCREVEKDPDGYLDVWARAHGKTSIITTAGAIQEILKNPELTIAIFSHTSSVAKAFLSQIKRELESNNDLKALFPDILYAEPEKQSPSWSVDGGLIVKRKSNPKEASLEASGLVDGMPTAKHYQLLIYDDVVTERSVATEDQIQKTNEAWSLSDNLGSWGARRWIIGTRYSFFDTYALIMERGAAKLRKYPATEDGTLDGEPVLLSQEAWDKKKQDQLPSTVAAQLLCDPQAAGQRMFDINDIPQYEVRPSMLMVYIMVDPAHSLKKDSDDTAMVVIGIDHAWNRYLLDGVAHKMELADKWRWLRELWERWRYRETGVQGVFVGYEKYGAISDIAYLKERMSQEGVHFDIEELSWPKSGGNTKKDRVQRLGPDFKSHRFYVPYPTHPSRYTSAQRRRKEEGYPHLIARRIARRDENNKVYDLTERFLKQVESFPFCQKKDIIDAVARIYDMEVRAPVYIDAGPLEPEAV